MWILESAAPYLQLDLAVFPEAKVKRLLERYADVETIVVGVRSLLFAPNIHSEAQDLMVKGLKIFLSVALQSLKQLKFVLHVSPVAVTDHLRAQTFWNERRSLPDLSEYRAPYDLFKRRSEVAISEICQQHDITCCHWRLSAIFSDQSICIQCRALDMQSRVGSYLPEKIDCNSSANVCRAIDAILARAERTTDDIKEAYYYTRPLSLANPVGYGYYLQEFRKAAGILAIAVPLWVVSCFVAFVSFVERVYWSSVRRRSRLFTSSLRSRSLL